MNKLLPLVAPLLKRVLHTNKFTSIGAGIALLGVLLLLTHHLSATDFLAMLGCAVTVIGFASKDGVRADVPVAPENVTPGPDVRAGGTFPALLLLWLTAACAVAGCASELRYAGIEPTALMLASTHPVPGANYNQFFEATPDSIDLPPMTKREVRKYRRAQRRALKIAARQGPAKIKLTGGSAYNAAPDGVAVARPAAPVVVGDSSVATDNRNLGQHANGGVSSGPKAGPTTGASVPPPVGRLAALGTWLSNTFGAVLAGVLLLVVVLAGAYGLYWFTRGAGWLVALLPRRRDANAS